MLNTNCAWCNRETEFTDRSIGFDDSANYICPACLIDLLPKTPVRITEYGIYGENRRIHKRYPVISSVYLSTTAGFNKYTKIILMDISDSGMKIQLQEKLVKDESITLGFLSEDLVYKAVGRVKHTKELQLENEGVYQAGIEITGIHQDLRVG